MLPKVAASFGRWREGWRDEREEAAESRRRFSRDEREAEATAMRAEIARLRSDLEAATDALAASRENTLARDELQKQLAADLEVERERRVDELSHQAARRLGQRDLARAWEGLASPMKERKQQRAILNAASGRFMLPRVAASFAQWRDGWDASRSAAAERGRQLLAEEQEREKESLREEIR